MTHSLTWVLKQMRRAHVGIVENTSDHPYEFSLLIGSFT